MAAWNFRVYGGKMQEVIKGMEQLKFTFHPSPKQKRIVFYQNSLQTIRIFIVTSQKKTGQTDEFIY